MADPAQHIATAKKYLRRKYASDLTGLRALADKIAEEALGDAVTLTGLSAEGGSQTGQLVFPRIDYLAAIEDVIREIDPDYVESPAEATRAVFRQVPSAYSQPAP